jgi:hypothetical protein
MYANRYTPALWSASYLLWSFEESRIALLSHYVYVSPHIRAELRRSPDAGAGSGWNGLCLVYQHLDEEGALDRPSAPLQFDADAYLQQP